MTPEAPTPHTHSAEETREAFSADWLSLREPFDASARESAAQRLRLPSRLAKAFKDEPAPWRVMDLGCGTGANLRWLAPRLGAPQQWLVVDHDLALLQAWPSRFERAGVPLQNHAPDVTQAAQWPVPEASVQIVRRQLDLARQLQELPWHAVQLVTASALIDLVSEDWLLRLVDLASAAGAAVLMTLSVDGRHRWWPADPHDGAVNRAFAAHQRRDKGFGPALGARAVPVLEAALRRAGYQVFKARSDWQLHTDGHASAQALYRAMVEGMGQAVLEQEPAEAERTRAWQYRRLAGTANARLTVGHLDLLALPHKPSLATAGR
jgi:SAM-dependent methyltransferase